MHPDPTPAERAEKVRGEFLEDGATRWRRQQAEMLELGRLPVRPVPPSARKAGRYTPPDPVTRQRKALRRRARQQRRKGRK